MIRLAAVVLATTLAAACAAAPEPAGPSLRSGSADAAPFTILWLGDTLLGDAAQSALDANGYDWPFQRLTDALEADVTVVNLEGPVTTNTTAWDPDQRWRYNA